MFSVSLQSSVNVLLSLKVEQSKVEQCVNVLLSLKVEQSKVAQLSREVQCREDWLGEERREREELEADLECNRVSHSTSSVDILLGVNTGKVNASRVLK